MISEQLPQELNASHVVLSVRVQFVDREVTKEIKLIVLVIPNKHCQVRVAAVNAFHYQFFLRGHLQGDVQEGEDGLVEILPFQKWLVQFVVQVLLSVELFQSILRE